MKKTFEDGRIHEALALLNEVAGQEKALLRDMLNDRYEALKDFVENVEDEAGRGAKRIYAAGEEKVREAVEAVDTSVHTNPWGYIGGAAAVGLLYLPFAPSTPAEALLRRIVLEVP